MLSPYVLHDQTIWSTGSLRFPPPKPCMRLCSPPYVLHDQTIWSTGSLRFPPPKPCVRLCSSPYVLHDQTIWSTGSLNKCTVNNQNLGLILAWQACLGLISSWWVGSRWRLFHRKEQGDAHTWRTSRCPWPQPSRRGPRQTRRHSAPLRQNSPHYNNSLHWVEAFITFHCKSHVFIKRVRKVIISEKQWRVFEAWWQNVQKWREMKNGEWSVLNCSAV